MRYLLDNSAFIALGCTGHTAHKRAKSWLANAQRAKAELFICSISELGFIRVLVGAGYVPNWATALDVLHRVRESISIGFLPDDVPLQTLPDGVKSANDTTDAHLAQLAEAHQMRLVTLDRRITTPTVEVIA
jgi:predicted nucleic acid-binding protein